MARAEREGQTVLKQSKFTDKQLEMVRKFHQLASEKDRFLFEKLVDNSALHREFPDISRFEEFLVNFFSNVWSLSGSNKFEIGNVGEVYRKAGLIGEKFYILRSVVTKHIDKDIYHDLGPVGWDAVIHSMERPLAITFHQGSDRRQSYRIYLSMKISDRPVIVCIQENLKKVISISSVITAFGIGPDIISPGDIVLMANGVFATKEKPLLVDAAAGTLAVLYNRRDSIIDITPFSEDVKGQGKPDVLAQAAYHGSAYLFDKFKTDKVNSGEGSQSFGWGLYFTQSKHIAAEYAQRQGDLKFEDGGRVAGLPDLLSVMGGESESLKKFEDTVDRISGKPGRWKEVLDNFCVGIGASDNDVLKAIDYASFETRLKGNTFDEMMKSRSSGLTDKEDAVKAALDSSTPKKG